MIRSHDGSMQTADMSRWPQIRKGTCSGYVNDLTGRTLLSSTIIRKEFSRTKSSYAKHRLSPRPAKLKLWAKKWEWVSRDCFRTQYHLTAFVTCGPQRQRITGSRTEHSVWQLRFVLSIYSGVARDFAGSMTIAPDRRSLARMTHDT